LPIQTAVDAFISPPVFVRLPHSGKQTTRSAWVDMKQLLLFLAAIALLSVTACVYVDPDVEKPAHELAQNGLDEFNDGDYRKAIQYFEKVRDWYPFSQHAKMAELKIADAHFRLKEYEEAIAAYEEFQELHPTHESIPYIVHQIGLCYFNRLRTIDRDQTMALKAIETFDQLIKNYPESSFVQDAKEKIDRCRKNLAEHDFYVGHFYYRTKHYKAALFRFKEIVQNYPNFEAAEKASRYIALCEAALKKESAKADTLE
jgi:outer membrane protein assembly factor BamD